MSPRKPDTEPDRGTALATALRQQIERAICPERHDRALRLLVHRFTLRVASRLEAQPPHHVEKKLAALIQAYARYLPLLVSEFDQGCRQSGWQEVSRQSQTIIAAFFGRTDLDIRVTGLLSLIDKIFFAHRLIEELHDHLMCERLDPAIRWNMTATNLMIHQLLGEEHASRLDMTAIGFSKTLLQAPTPIPVSDGDRQYRQWPCFNAAFGISFTP